jgi:HTH-type transcriptional regulator, quorum sensing regulator NprR
MVKAETIERYADGRLDAFATNVGQRIRMARLERSMSLADVGREDLSRSFLSLVELGRSRISLRALAIVAERLELPVGYFLRDAQGEAQEIVELRLDQADAALARQESADALETIKDLEPPETFKPRLLWIRGRALVEEGRPREAIAAFQDGLSIAEKSRDLSLLAYLRYGLGLAVYSAGSFDEALTHLRQSLTEASEGPNDPTLIGRITICIGHVLYVRGDVDGAIEEYVRAQDLFGSVMDLQTQGSVYSGLSLAFKSRGDLPTALRFSKMGLAALEARQNGRLASIVLNNLAVRYQELGDLEQALDFAQQAVMRAEQVNAGDVEAGAHSLLASIYLSRDDVEKAMLEARKADELARDDTDPARIEAWLVLADIAERGGDRAADRLYQWALGVLQRTDRHIAYADAALRYSLLLKSRGETDKALEYAIEAAQARSRVSETDVPVPIPATGL